VVRSEGEQNMDHKGAGAETKSSGKEKARTSMPLIVTDNKKGLKCSDSEDLESRQKSDQISSIVGDLRPRALSVSRSERHM
jgi:hypothetical protein